MKLTNFQTRVLDAIERGPNRMANWIEVAWNGFPNEWNSKPRSRGILITNIQRAADVLRYHGLIVILSPRDQYDSATYCSHRDQDELFKPKD